MRTGQWYLGCITGDHFIVVPVVRQVNGSFKAIFYHFDRRRAVFGSTNYMHVPDMRETTPEEVLKQFGKTEGNKAVTRIQARLGEVS